jgi:hypothetical protein
MNYFASLLLPNGPDRRSMVERVLRDLDNPASQLQLLTPRPLIAQRIESYVEGKPHSGRIFRGMSLDVRVAVDGEKDAELFLEEITDEIVRLDIAFAPSAVRPSGWDLETHRIDFGNTRHFMHFLLALDKILPCLVGTLSLDLLASDLLGLEDGQTFCLADGMSLEQLAGPLYVPGADYQFDFAIINPAISGSDKPLIHSLIGKPGPDGETDARYHDLDVLEGISMAVAHAERAYSRMYESRTPREDRSDALIFLSKAIGLAASIGLEKEAARLEQRSEHIDAVFNAQFRH